MERREVKTQRVLLMEPFVGLEGSKWTADLQGQQRCLPLSCDSIHP